MDFKVQHTVIESEATNNTRYPEEEDEFCISIIHEISKKLTNDIC
jgi:hypothetical protein